MAKQYKVLVNTAKAEDNLVLDVPQSKGAKGGPLVIKAKAGQKYQLQEITNATDKPVAPDYVKTRRVGKNLHILFEGDKEASVIIEDYYDVAAEGSNGLIGQAENGSFYEYIPEDPNSDGLVPNLRDGGEAVNVALGGDEVQAAGAAVGLLVFNPLLAALGAGAAAAAAAAGGGAAAAAVDPTPTPTPTTPSGALAGASDTGAAGDNRTKDTNPELTGKATAGSTVVIDLKDATGKVIGTYSTTADANGNYSIKVPQNLADGTYTPTIKVTSNGTTTTTDGTSFTIDTVAPTIAVSADKTSLLKGDTTTVTFTLSETVTDFTAADVQVTGGTLSGFAQSATDPKVYTALFTPSTNSTTPSVITVANGRFSDTASNFNADGAEVNNTVNLPTNTNANGATGAIAPASDTGTQGDNKTNDNTPSYSGKAPANASVVVVINGKSYPTKADANGNYSIVVPDADKLPDGTYTPKIIVTPDGSTSSTTSDATPFTIDTTPPTVTIAAEKSTLSTGQTSNLTFTLSEVSTDFTAADVNVTGGTLSGFVQSATDPKVYTAVFTPTANLKGNAAISVDTSKFSDPAANPNKVSNTVTLATDTTVADTTPPTIAITSDKTSLTAGQAAVITFTLSEASSDFTAADVAVTGGTLSNFVQDSTNPKVYKAVFTPNTNSTTDGVISVASSKFSDASGNFNTDGAEANNKVTLSTNTTTSTATGALAPASDTGTTGDNKTLDNTPDFQGTATPGAAVSVVINGKTYTATADASGKYAFNVPDLLPDGTYTPEITVTPTGGTPSKSNGTPFTIDTTTTVAISKSGTANSKDPISGTAEAGDVVVLKDANGNIIGSTTADASGNWSLTPANSVPSGSITAIATDAAGNVANATGANKVAPTSSVKTAMSLDPITTDNIISTTEGAASTYTVTGKVTGIFAAGDVVTLVSNGKNYTAAVAADGSFSTAVSMSDLKADAGTKILGSVTGTGGDTATAGQDYAVETASNAGSQTALSIDPITADNNIGSSEATGNIAVTGKVTGKFSAGDTVTLTVNGKTFTGTAAANGSYSISVPASDLTADSDTKVEGVVTGTGGTAATAFQDYATNANINPTPAPVPSVLTALSIDPITSDNIITTTEGAATSYTVTGKVTGTFVAGDTVSLSLNGKVFTAVAGADGSFSAVVSMADLKADPGTKITGTIKGTGGDTATAGQDYVVETSSNAGTQTALSINPVTADNNISSSEASGNIAITGQVTGKFSAGDTVTLTVNGKTFTGPAAANGSFSISVPGSDLTADSDTQVDGTVSGTGGTTATAFQDYATNANINPTPPSNKAVGLAIAISTDANNDAFVNIAELGSATNFTSHVSVNSTAVVGDKVVVNASNGSTVLSTITHTLTAGDIANGFDVTFTNPADGVIQTVTANYMDASGNAATDAAPTDSAQLDISAPTQTVAFSSMTKDTGIASVTNNNSDWLTSDASAGRLVSGTISAPLGAGEVVVVFVDKGDGNGPQPVGTTNGIATVSGKAWEISDLNGYNSSWTYSAKVFDASGNSGTLKTQVVNADLTEAAPTITGVLDAGNAAVGATGTNATNLNPTTKTLNSVSGTGAAGDVIYLYDNSGTYLVGSTTVAANGTWTVTGLKGTFTGVNSFSAKQIDALGNESVLSNLWTVSATGTNQVVNGDFSNGLTGWTTYGTVNNNSTSGQNFYGGVDQVGVMPASYFGAAITNRANSNFTKTGTSASGNMSLSVIADLNNAGNPDGRFVGNTFGWNEQTPVLGRTVFLSQKVSVVAGNTYSFSFDMQGWQVADVRFYLGDTFANFGFDTIVGGTSFYQLGKVSGTFTATTTGLIDMAFTSDNQGDLGLDNLTFSLNATAANNSLTPGGTAPATPADNTLSYSGGNLHALGGNDVVISVGSDIQSTLSSGGFINGGAGVDTLKLAAGTNLNLETLTGNQTVKPIQEVEVFQMQGGSTLTLSTNDVLSLGAANLAGFSFASTTGGSASTSSTGKVQFVVNATSTDNLVLDPLQTDGVTTNGTVGNTGLAGQWDYMGTTTIGGTVYKVYNSNNTAAQVLTMIDPEVNTNAIAITSMSKDSGVTGTTNDWLTADASAGRVVSGTLGSPLLAGDVVKVYADGVLIGNATVNAAGTAWEITDTNGYSGNWVYSANVVSASGKTSATAYQPVHTDLSEAAPVITGVVDTASTSVANTGTTTKEISSVSGTGNAGDTIYLYDNSVTQLIGTATVASNGTWTVSGFALGVGSQTFAAKQYDVLNNLSTFSNTWQVTSDGRNLLVNGDFSAGNTGFTSNGSFQGGNNPLSIVDTSYTTSFTVGQVFAATTVATTTTNSGTFTGGSFKNDYVSSNGNPNGKMSGAVLYGQNSGGTQNAWSETVSVTAGKTYEFSFDYDLQAFIGVSNFVYIDGQKITLSSVAMNPNAFLTANGYQYNQSGNFTATYTATTSKTITLAVETSSGGYVGRDFVLDNFKFTPDALAGDNSLTAGGTAPATNNGDNLTLPATGGVIRALGGNDVITSTDTAIQAKLAAGVDYFINGGGGVDTLKLAAGTALDLTKLTTNQTVKGIQEVEVFELQGTSTLTLSANDVLSLGQANAFSTGGKVQMMIKGTSTDTVALQNLLSDGAGGNTGLDGMWVKDSSTVSINSVTFNVYNHSTTGAQVLVQASITNVTVSASPLVLDLNGDGVQTTDVAHGTQFDLFNTGSKQHLGWVDKHDGLLAIDLNHDGQVNNGSELLGTSTKLADGSLAKDGWQALAQYDKNADGVIDAKDAVFKDLQVWVDGNGDGVSETGEVKSLADLGIQSINLHHDSAQATQNGNVLQGFSSYTTTDGQSHQVSDAWLNTQASDSATGVVNTFKLLDMGMTLDLTAVTHPKNVEAVDLSDGVNAGHNTIKMDLSSFIGLSDVLDNPATAGVNESKMLVVNGHAGDSAELTDSLNWNTVMTGQTAATLSSTFGEAYHFVPGHTYSQLNQNGTTLFIDEAITRNTHG